MNLITPCRRFVGHLKLHGAQKFMVAVVGGSVVLVGIAMLVLPGPAILVIPLGLAILATEFHGLLLAYPVREIFLRVVNVRGAWGYLLPLDLTMSTSMLYELAEWGTAAAFGGDLGQAYLGTQGDVWDAHKDMALASLGAVIAMCITAAINWRLQRDFAASGSRACG